MERQRSNPPSSDFAVQKMRLLQEPRISPYDIIRDKLDESRKAIERIGKIQTAQTVSEQFDAVSLTYDGVCAQLEDARDKIVEQTLTIK